MKKALLILIISVVGLVVKGQEPDWIWGERAGSLNTDEGYSITSDNNGNKYVTGYFASSSIVFGTVVLNNSGTGSSVFIVKYNSANSVVWAKCSSGNGFDIGRGIAVDHSGNVFITGFYQSSTITFDTISLTNNASPRPHIFVAKYNQNGDIQWAKSYGGNNSDYGYGIATDATGNVFVTGYFTSLSVTIGSTTLVNSNSCDDSVCAFIAKFDAAGNSIWAKMAIGCSMSYSVAVDNLDNSYITGFIESDSLILDSYTLYTQGGYAMFIVKFDPNGNVEWAKNSDGIIVENGQTLTTDGGGNIFQAGTFRSSTINIDTITLTNFSNDFDIFVAKYNSSGNVIWAKSMGGNGDDGAYGISTGANGSVYIVGSFSSTVIYFANDTLINAGSFDVLVAKFDSVGNPVWAKSGDGPNTDYGYGITVINNDDYITGSFGNPLIDFGNIELENDGNLDYYIAELGYITTTANHLINSIGDIKLYPNPFLDKTILKINKEIKDNLSLIIYDVMGCEVSSVFIGNKKEITINRDNFPSGMYFFKIISDNKEVFANGKMVVE